MIALSLFWEFLKVGAFAIGGGLATIPFLVTLSQTSGWYTVDELANMVAVAESTPGPIGVNVATYVGFKVLGVGGGIIATLGLITPSFIVILIISTMLDKFRNSKAVNDAFHTIRPASSGLITAALYSLVMMSFFTANVFDWRKLALAALLFVLTNYVPKVKKLHPVVFLLFAAAVGIVLGF